MKRTAFCVALVFIVSARASAADAPEAFDSVVLAFRTSMVNAKTVGNVSSIAVKEGQKVAQGELLAQLDDTLARANYEISQLQADDTTAVESARLQLAQAQRDLERAKQLDLTVSKNQIEEAQYAYDLSKTVLTSKQLESTRLQAIAAARKAALDEYAVRAPFAGIVAQKMIEVGETSAPVERRLFEIIDISRVYIDVHPQVAYAGSLVLGDKAVVSCDILPDMTFSGSISFISPSFDLGSAYFAVKVLVENPAELLRPGMKARVAFPDKIPGPAESPAPEVAPAPQPETPK